MKIKLQTLTPIHIGSGEEISPIEYVLLDTKKQEICTTFQYADKFIRLDMTGLFADQNFDIEKFVESTKQQNTKQQIYIGDFLQKNLLLKHQLYSLNISPSAKNSNPIVVKSFIKTAGRVYIPGSSLKGAILSAVIYKIAKEKRINNLPNYEKLLSEVLNEVSVSNSGRFSHWLDVSDSDLKLPQEALEIFLAKVEGTKMRSLPVLLEALKPGLTFVFEMKTSLDSFYKFGKLSEDAILQAVKEFYHKVYQKEKNWAEQRKVNVNLPKVNDNDIIIRLGHGCSVLSTSLLILAEELRIQNYSISRKKLPPIKPGEFPRTKKLISENNLSLGWAKITIES